MSAPTSISSADVPVLVPVDSPEQRAAAEELIAEYLEWVGGIARSAYGLEFDIDAMVRSDLDDAGKFYPPTGRFYLVRFADDYVGVGCLKRIAPGVGEIQRMYVRPYVRGAGAGRRLVEGLVADARSLGYLTLRLESLRALTAAHQLYRSIGFVEIDPYAENSMAAFQDPAARERYRRHAIFMEARLPSAAG
jgi:GNAT superfamily N-acetyltransferase